MTASHPLVAPPPPLVDTVLPTRKDVHPLPLFSEYSLPRGGPWRDFQTPGSVTFFLTAPYKPAVCLVGDFNGWDATATPMHTEGSGLFWVTVRLAGPTHYRFVVTVDGSGKQVTVADPYAREIRWDANGPKAFFSDEVAYQWQHTGWCKPALRDLVIYELCVRDFTGEKRDGGARFGTFREINSKLDHLAGLGINAIELMPICEFPGDSSWGYNPVFYMAPKWIYGSPNSLKALIDSAHGRGIAVILDMVFNHAWPQQPYYQIYPPLFGPRGEMLEDLNPFFHHHHNSHANAWGGLDWEHSSRCTVRYMQDIVRFWLEEFQVDGFRFDWLGGVEYDPFKPHMEGFDPFSGIAPIARAAREASPDCYLIGEYWPIHGTNPAKTAARLVHETEIDAIWNGAFHHGLENCLFQTWQWEQQSISHVLGGFRQQGFTSADQVVNYVVSHDERRPEHEIQFWGEHIQPGKRASIFPARWDLALQKARLGLSVLLTSPGVPMLLAGQEFGEDSPRTIDFWPLDWKKLALPQGRVQFDLVQKLIRLRREHPALRSDFVEYYWDDFCRYKVVRYKRWDGDSDVVVVAANFDNIDHRIGLGFPTDGWWRNALTGVRHHVQGHWRDFTLPAWSVLILAEDV